MSDFIEMMGAPLVMALILVAMHAHLGHHVVKRGVIFVDIALAQVAAFGVAISLLIGGEVGSDRTWLIAMASTCLGAWLIARTRTREERAPQEAYIGIIYVVASAAMILVLTQVPHGGDEIRHLLVGAILWVSWSAVLKTGILYALLGTFLYRWRQPLARVSTDPVGARRDGLSLRKWDFVFYAILGVVVTSSVQIAGVLLVFSLLAVPTVICRWPAVAESLLPCLARRHCSLRVALSPGGAGNPPTGSPGVALLAWSGGQPPVALRGVGRWLRPSPSTPSRGDR